MLAGFAEVLPVAHSNFSLSFNARKLFSSEESDPLRRHMEWLGSFPAAARERLRGEALRGKEKEIFEPVERFARVYEGSKENRLLYAYARSYLLDEVLVKVDRASMHYGLEVRAPLLDREIIDFVFALPYRLKYRRGRTKYLFKKLMQGRLPTHSVSRKKKGFGVPMARWLAGPLRPLCEELLSPLALRAHGLFSEGEVKRLIEEHVAMRRDNRKELWNLMVFQIWYNRWIQKL
jgi:asparagine synthase (glutamine-hydrolysing)